MIALVIVLFASLLLLNIWGIVIRPARSWAAKIGLLLQIVGIYTFAFSVVTQTDILPRDIANDMTSPDLFRFLRGNFVALAAVFSAMSVAAEPAKTSIDAFAFLQLFETIGVVAVGTVFAAFTSS